MNTNVNLPNLSISISSSAGSEGFAYSNHNCLNSPKPAQPAINETGHQTNWEKKYILSKQQIKYKQVTSSDNGFSLIVQRLENKSNFNLSAFQDRKMGDSKERKFFGNIFAQKTESAQNRNDGDELRQNCPPNKMQYGEMHRKLNILQDKLNYMKQKLIKKQDEKKKEIATHHRKLDNLKRDKNKKDDRLLSQSIKFFVTKANIHRNQKPFSINISNINSAQYYVSTISRQFLHENSFAREHIISSFQQLVALSKIKGPCDQQLKNKKIYLQKKKQYQGCKTIVFDLDETLIHCNDSIDYPCDTKVKVKFPTGQVVQAGINIRPHAQEILKRLSKNFQIIVFTASHSCYANEVINFLDPHSQYISHRLFRQHCYQSPQGVYIKDLRILNRDLSNLVLIDNAAYSYVLQLQNGIPILPFYQSKDDVELKKLQEYLESLTTVEDVRDVNRITFKLNKYAQFSQIELLVSTLYGFSQSE